MPSEEVNLIANPGFEEGFTNWSHSSNPANSGTEAIVSEGCISAHCVKMQLGAIDPATGKSISTYQQTSQTVNQPNTNNDPNYQSKISPGKYYRLSAWFKTTPYHSAYFNLYDPSWKDKNGTPGGGSHGKGFTRINGGTGDWQKIEEIFQIPLVDDFGETTADDQWMVLLYTQTPLTNVDAVFYDNVNFALIGDNDPNAIVPLGSNNSLHSKSVDFGSETNMSWVTPSDALSATKETDGDVSFHSIQPKKALTVQFPAFNYDSDNQGLPDSPMVLEFKYRDDIDATEAMIDSRNRHRAIITSFIDYQGDADLSSQQDKKNYEVGGLGEKGDKKTWKVAQILFDKSQFQLIRAIDDKYTFKITMPNLDPADQTLTLPINYIALHAISQADYDVMAQKERDRNGFYLVPPPEKEPTGITYPDPNLTLFTRDIMQPVYHDTLPQLNEVLKDNQALSSSATLNLAEVLNFGIHSPEGIENLNFEASDLTSETGAKITQDNIAINHVVSDYKRITQSTASVSPYSLVPDRLEKAEKLTVDPGKSERIWVKITPKGVPSGKYTGNLNIKQGNKVLRSIPMELNVLGIELDHSAQINVLADPFYKVVSPDISKTLDFYKGTDLDLHIASVGTVVSYDQTKPEADQFTFDLSRFKRRIEQWADQGILDNNNSAVLTLDGTVSSIYAKLYPGLSASTDTDLWQHLSDPKFGNALNKVVSQMEAIGQGADRNNGKNLTFIFQESDEPGTDPQRRIFDDRIYTILHGTNLKTTITYYNTCDQPVSDSGIYKVPVGSEYLAHSAIPALTNLVDYKVWHLSEVNADNGENNGYYTTYYTQLRDPIYDRFYHGIYAYKTGAKIAYAYTMGDWIGAPFNDFDRSAQNVSSTSMAFDYLVGYSTWSGDVLPTMAAEGIREGIKDSRYFATLERLINEHPGEDANKAKVYLDSLKDSVQSDYNASYTKKGGTYGHADVILNSISGGDGVDYSAFSNVRNTVIGYINTLSQTSVQPPVDNQPTPTPTPAGGGIGGNNGANGAIYTPSAQKSIWRRMGEKLGILPQTGGPSGLTAPQATATAVQHQAKKAETTNHLGWILAAISAAAVIIVGGIYLSYRKFMKDINLK